MSVCAPIVEALRAVRFNYGDEDRLQEGIAAALAAVGFDVEREVRLSARDRIDLLVGRVGIEVKVAGSPGSVANQLLRYAKSDRIDGLVLVTSRVRHLAPMVLGKPIEVVQLAGAGL
ncbi:MAG: hypothetical protein ACRDK4_04880 [Solirubrobacteraceae bacterium]